MLPPLNLNYNSNPAAVMTILHLRFCGSPPLCTDKEETGGKGINGKVQFAGGQSAVIELGEPTSRHINWMGFTSWLAWRSAYLTRLGTIPNRIYVAINW